MSKALPLLLFLALGGCGGTPSVICIVCDSDTGAAQLTFPAEGAAEIGSDVSAIGLFPEPTPKGSPIGEKATVIATDGLASVVCTGKYAAVEFTVE